MLHRNIIFNLLFTFIFFAHLNIYCQTSNLDSQNGKALVIEKNYVNSTIDGYNIFIPNNYDGNKKMPVIVFLQGSLGVGGRVSKIFSWALPNLILTNTNNELNSHLDNFIYIMPHIKSGQFYNNENAIRSIIKEVSNKYNVDNKRIYLTGLSRGGYGTWGLASKMTDVFAAIAPICGGTSGIKTYDALLDYPIWASHNTDDQKVRHEFTEKIISTLEEKGRTFQRINSLSKANYKSNDRIFVSTPSDSHDAWTDFYKNKDFYSWLLRFKKD